MGKRTIALVLALLGVAGCAVEEEGCYTNEDCGDGWICDTTTGACVPIEEYDTDFAGNDSPLPDTVDTDAPSVTDDTTMNDTDAAVEADTVADNDTIVDADTLPAESDTVTDTDVDLTDDTGDEDADVAFDDAPPAVDDSLLTDADTDTVTDTAPDTDTSCTGCACEDCSGHGTCTTANGYVECICDTGYGGGYCQQCDIEWQDHDGDGICEADDCAHATDPIDGWLDCGDHGTCDDWGFEADCECDMYWTDMSGECDYCFGDPEDC